MDVCKVCMHLDKGCMKNINAHCHDKTLRDQIANMATQKNKFGHLPLSTSGPQDCAITVSLLRYYCLGAELQ